MAMLFIKPLMVAGKNIRGNWKHSRLHRVAMRTFIASIISLIASFANIIWLAVYHDGQRDVICLTSCAIDVTINVVTIHWVTTNPKKSPENNRSMPAKITKNTGSGLPITSPFSDFVDSQKSRFSTMTMELEAHNRSDDFHCPIDIMSNTSEQQARTFQTAHVNDTTLPTISSVAPQHPRNPSIPESAYRNDARL
ncbi:hypothetical protein BDF14DRAFT_311735 [Spinellus fusiger]|nr:hypothetical protein BDF14DRAFT_311735 [Spinellus fusiger]